MGSLGLGSIGIFIGRIMRILNDFTLFLINIIEYLKMLGNNNELQPQPHAQSSLRSQIHSQIASETQKITQMLSTLSSLKTCTKILNECSKNSSLEQDDRKQKAFIWKYDKKYDYSFEAYFQEPFFIGSESQCVALRVEARNNWIGEYLDQPGVKVFGRASGEDVLVLGEDQGVIRYQKMRQGNVKSEQVHEMKLKDFYLSNKEMAVQFTANRYVYRLANNLVRFQLDAPQTLILELKHEHSRESDEIRRVLIHRLQKIESQEQQMLLQSRNSKDQQYRLHQGFYEPQNFLQPITLQAGCYLLQPFPSTALTLYAPCPLAIDIVPSQLRNELQELNLMLQCFPECHIENMKAQFIRECDLCAGIVIEVYRNVFQNQIWVRDDGPARDRQEDKRLMFQSLYSKRYQSYRLRTGETIVEFYEVTRKPAVLFQPHKKVIVDKDEDSEAKTIHSILR